MRALVIALVLAFAGCGTAREAVLQTTAHGTVLLRTEVGAFEAQPAAAEDLQRLLAGESGAREYLAF